MKHSSKIYARALIEAAKEGSAKKIASDFWFGLQKNGQYKDLAKILDSLDEEFASEENKSLAKIYSAEKLSLDTLKEIERKVSKKTGRDVLIKPIIKRNITGVLVKVDDLEVDLSLEGKINKLKHALSNN